MVKGEDDCKKPLYAFGHGQMADRVLMLWVGEDGSGVLSTQIFPLLLLSVDRAVWR